MFSLLFALIFSFQTHAADVESVLAPIPVQDSGRVKPFDSFARGSLQLIYGKREYKGKSAVEVVFTWMILPQHWEEVEFIQIDNKLIREKLGFSVTRKHFSPKEIVVKDELQVLLSDLKDKKDNKVKLDPYYQAVDRLQNQLTLFKAISQGFTPGFIPPQEGGAWLTLKDFPSEFADLFVGLTRNFAASLKEPSQFGEFEKSVQVFIERAKSENISLVPSQRVINLEVQYNQLHPFQLSWIMYLLSSILFMLYFIYKKDFFFRLSFISMMIGFVIHTYGFILRIIIAERPPVTNMYETVVWVPWGAVLFAIFFMAILKNRMIVFAASLLSFVCLVLADLAPVILDPSLQPLQPVLRSNLWLTVHVLTITISYGAFFLSFIMGDISLVFYALNEEKFKTHLNSLRELMYRSVQVGVVLLGAGTILGGVWADYSWGRFWGWDPKETWALIAFLGYIAILHGRLAGWIKPFGFAFWNVLAFNLVIMAWYGVNYVLGAGLHSYGFGGGGLPFVSAFCGAHLVFALFVWWLRSQKLSAKKQ